MSNPYILAIDQGTTNSKVLLVDISGKVIAQVSYPVSTRYPRPGWVEQDPLGLWESVQRALDLCVAEVGELTPRAVAVTNQRESIMLWERPTGRPLGPCIVWQCRRTGPLCDELRRRGFEPYLRERTGLTIDPLFSASKARWLLDHAEKGQHRAERGELCLGTVDSWVLWNLTRGAVHACDVTNASRTQLFNIHSLAWDEDLLALFGIPLAALPEVKPSSAIYGSTTGGALPRGIPITAMIGDSHAALFGQAGFEEGTVKATYGTGTSLMTLTREPVLSPQGLSTTIAWQHHRVAYALEGNISVSGAGIQWMAELLGLANPVEDAARLAASVDDTDGVYFVPALVGLGAPYWDDTARGLIAGLSFGSSPAHLVRAALESVAFQIRDVFSAMEAERGGALQMLLADGGASRNDLLMQFQADILGRPVVRTLSADASALGAAYLAGLTVDFWRSVDDVAELPRERERFEPRLSMSEREQRYAGWQAAVARCTSKVSRPSFGLERVGAS